MNVEVILVKMEELAYSLIPASLLANVQMVSVDQSVKQVFMLMLIPFFEYSVF